MIGTAVASITKDYVYEGETYQVTTYYATFEDAVAARETDDDVVTLLATTKQTYTYTYEDVDDYLLVVKKVTLENGSTVTHTVNRVKSSAIPADSADMAYKDSYITAGTATKYYLDAFVPVVEYTDTSGAVTYQKTIGSSGTPTTFAGNGTYKLLADLNVTARITTGILASNVTLDLNGHTLTSTAADCGVLLSRNGSASSHKSLSIIDSSEAKGGTFVVNSNANAAIQTQSSKYGKYNDVTIGEGVTIEGGCIALLSDNDTLTVNGTINGGADFAVVTNGSTSTNNTIAIGAGAKLTSDITAMYLAGAENLVVTVSDDAQITGATGIEIRAGQLNISGNPTITATGDFSEAANDNGTTVNGAAVAVSQHTTNLPISVNITGGTLKGAKSLYEVDLQDEIIKGVTITVTDGKFSGEVASENVTNFLDGGYYSVEPEQKYVVEGKNAVANLETATKDEYPFVIGEGIASVTSTDGTVVVYTSLPDAVAAAKTGETIKLLKDASGAGIFLSKADKKSITIDLDKHTYTVTAAVGSTGTKNQGLHAEKGNAVTLKNGTFTSSADSGVRMLVQNYCDLTLEDVTLDGTKLPDSKPYTLSNNCGKVTIGNGTTIIAKDDGYAFDVCSTKHYPDGAQVTVAEGATINGNIELGVWDSAPATNKATLTVNGGAINGEIVNNSNGAITKADVVLNAGVYTVDPSTTVKATYPLACYPVKNADGKFEIQPSLESADIEVLFKSATPERTYVYSGSAIEPVTGVQVNKDISQIKSLVAFIKAPITDKVELNADDYTVSYKNNVNTGTATATITATDGSLFKGTSTTRDFKITKASATITADDLSKVLGDNDPKLTVTVEGLCGKDKFAEGTDYTIARAKGESVGNYDITVTLVAENQNYDIACKGGTFTITSPKPVDLSKATIGKIADKVYTGKAIKPAPKVTLNGKTLKEGTDYTLVYKNNVNAGTATVTVVGKGAYTGKASATFTIKKAASTIKLADQTKAFNGKAQAYSGKVTKTGSTGKMTYKYYSDSACKKEVKAANVRKAGTYYVKGTVAADANHAAATSNAAKLTITPGTWQRYGGATALDTGRLVVEADGAFAKGRGGTVVVATSEGYWDALAAAGLAGTLDAPVLITPKDSLASQTAAEIKRLAPKRVLVMGGPAAVSDSTVKAIKALVPNTSRVYGATAPDTAVSIYGKGSGWGKTAIVATSKGYWDALSIAPYAWKAKAPIFLTKGTDDIPASALSALKGGGFTRVVIVGGTAAVSAGVASKVKSATGVTPTRLAGPNALVTSAAIAKWELKQGMGLSHMAVATSKGYWDALTAAAVCGKQNSVLVLVDPGGVYDAFDAVYDRSQLVHGHVLGGEAALPKDVWTYVNKA